MSLNQAGNQCPRCHQGDLIHRRFWHTTECQRCHWASGLPCNVCFGTGFTAMPSEDITVDLLREYHPQIPFIQGNP